MERSWAAGAGWLGAFEVKIHHDRVLTAAYHDGFTRLVGESVDLLMRHEGRNVDEVARSGLAAEFQPLSPPHAGLAADNVENGFELAVVVRSSLGIGLYQHRAGPEFGGSGSGVSDGGRASHAGSL